jgi:hypothetical protein
MSIPFEQGDMDWLKRIIDPKMGYQYDTMLSHGRTERIINRIEELEAQLEAVRPYIQHKRDCDIEAVHYAYEPECNCGLAALQGEKE